jgi:uncharacterized protein (TIGR02588 family)
VNETSPGQSRRNGKDASGSAGKQPSTSRWEWVAAGLGLIIVGAIIGYLIYFGMSEHGKVPVIEVQVIEIHPTPAGYVVRFNTLNRGGVTAAGLRIRGELRRGETVLEETETELDYVPPHSERKASLIFQADPGSGTLRITPTGYTDP